MRYTIIWDSDYPGRAPLIQRMALAHAQEQARQWRDELRRVPNLDNPPITQFQ